MGEALVPDDDSVVPVAIIGQACRFPGDGENVESLFDMLKTGRDAWAEFPSDRVNIDGFYHPSGQRQGSIGFRGAHFLKGDIKAFDAAVCGEYSHNPTHRLSIRETVLQHISGRGTRDRPTAAHLARGHIPGTREWYFRPTFPQPLPLC